MSARPKIAFVNPLVLDSMDRKARLFTGDYRVSEDGILGADASNNYRSATRPLTDDEKEIAAFCLNNWNMISAAIKAVN